MHKALGRGRICRRSLHSAATQKSTVQVTVLPNKIRVATESTPGHFSSVGLYVDAGARYETPATSGVSHFLDRMAFKSTTNRTDLEMTEAMNKLGGQIMCASSRESMMYQSSHAHQGTPLAMALIADTVINPTFLPEEIESQRDAAYYESREASAKPEQIIPEILHEVAYNAQGLGNPMLCPEERIPLIDAPLLRNALQEWYKPERMVIAGSGMQHEQLVELADKYFASLKATPIIQPVSSSRQPLSSINPNVVPPHLLSPSPTPSTLYKSMTRAASSYLYPSSVTPLEPPSALTNRVSPSTYTGGHRFIPDLNAEFNHLYIAFEGVGILDEDIYTLATMQILLGGGGSFSAGGPGKGMYSRLYTNILNNFPQIDHCASFHHIYNDSSLFGLFASVVPPEGKIGNTLSQVLPHLVHQLSQLVYVLVDAKELQRAKNQLKSGMLMALESKMVEVEDLGRQMLVQNRKVSVTEMSEHIDKITPHDVRRVATRLFGRNSGKPTVVTMGHHDTGDWVSTFQKYGVGAL